VLWYSYQLAVRIIFQRFAIRENSRFDVCAMCHFSAIGMFTPLPRPSDKLPLRKRYVHTVPGRVRVELITHPDATAATCSGHCYSIGHVLLLLQRTVCILILAYYPTTQVTHADAASINDNVNTTISTAWWRPPPRGILMVNREVMAFKWCGIYRKQHRGNFLSMHLVVSPVEGQLWLVSRQRYKVVPDQGAVVVHSLVDWQSVTGNGFVCVFVCDCNVTSCLRCCNKMYV
jgi:hypothetical protein